MRKILFTLIVCIAAVLPVSAQYTLQFCEDVNSEGKPTMVSNSFLVDQDGGVLKFLCKTEEKFNTDQLEFRVFYINESGNEENILKLPQKVESNWNFAWKEMVFFDPGSYRVKVYTGSGTYLTSANLNIKHR